MIGQLALGLALTPPSALLGWTIARAYLILRWLHAEHHWDMLQQDLIWDRQQGAIDAATARIAQTALRSQGCQPEARPIKMTYVAPGYPIRLKDLGYSSPDRADYAGCPSVDDGLALAIAAQKAYEQSLVVGYGVDYAVLETADNRSLIVQRPEMTAADNASTSVIP